jgi:hypothetical protein
MVVARSCRSRWSLAARSSAHLQRDAVDHPLGQRLVAKTDDEVVDVENGVGVGHAAVLSASLRAERSNPSLPAKAGLLRRKSSSQ